MTLHFHDWALIAWFVASALAAVGMGRAMRHASRDDYRDQEDRNG